MQCLRFSKSEFAAISISDAVRFVSSANRRGLVFLRHLGKSFIFNKNSNGPKIEPCGTPHSIKRSDDTSQSLYCWIVHSIADRHCQLLYVGMQQNIQQQQHITAPLNLPKTI